MAIGGKVRAWGRRLALALSLSGLAALGLSGCAASVSPEETAARRVKIEKLVPLVIDYGLAKDLRPRVIAKIYSEKDGTLQYVYRDYPGRNAEIDQRFMAQSAAIMKDTDTPEIHGALAGLLAFSLSHDDIAVLTDPQYEQDVRSVLRMTTSREDFLTLRRTSPVGPPLGRLLGAYNGIVRQFAQSNAAIARQSLVEDFTTYKPLFQRQ
jgi:hypothetical protein